MLVLEVLINNFPYLLLKLTLECIILSNERNLRTACALDSPNFIDVGFFGRGTMNLPFESQE